MIIDCQNIKCKKSFNTDDNLRSNRKAVWYVCPFCKKIHRLINEISDRYYIRQADGSLKRKYDKDSKDKELRKLARRTGKYAKINN